MIACNSANHWQEALQVYRQLRAAGLWPNTTTYNALVSAHSKAGDIEGVMRVFADMLAAGCARSVITYSTLIAACERAGRWEDAVALFDRMPADGCTPNTVTYNSVITALAQGEVAVTHVACLIGAGSGGLPSCKCCSGVCC
jgi:pentatricopeptide repeat domain-containing protein 1